MVIPRKCENWFLFSVLPSLILASVFKIASLSKMADGTPNYHDRIPDSREKEGNKCKRVYFLAESATFKKPSWVSCTILPYISLVRTYSNGYFLLPAREFGNCVCLFVCFFPGRQLCAKLKK